MLHQDGLQAVFLATELPRRLKYFRVKSCASCKLLAAPFWILGIAPPLQLNFINNTTFAAATISQPTRLLNSQIRGLSPTDFRSPLFSCCILCPVSHLIGTLQRPPWTGNPYLVSQCCFPSSLVRCGGEALSSSTITPSDPPFLARRQTRPPPFHAIVFRS